MARQVKRAGGADVAPHHARCRSYLTYAHVIEELEGTERVSADVQIRQARDELASVKFDGSDGRVGPKANSP